jgi:hypothetical protein
MLPADPTPLLIEIKGELGETKGMLAEVKGRVISVESELRGHRHEDRTELRRVCDRLDRIEQHQADERGARRVRAHGEIRRAGVVAALVAAATSVLGQFAAHWLK